MLRKNLKSLASLNRMLASATTRAAQWVSIHPRSLTTSVTLVLAGFGAAAFGIAPLVPDASNLPKRLLTEVVNPQDVEVQLAALAEHELQLYRSDLTRATDTADSLLRRLGVSDPSAAAFLRNDLVARRLLDGRGGKMIRVSIDESGALRELVARFAVADVEMAGTHFVRLSMLRINGKLQAKVETAALSAQVRLGSGTVRSSLFAATDEARIPDSVASQLAEVFATDIDFHSELRRGDSFSVVYEALTADGEPITWNAAAGRVIAAEFVNGGRSHTAIWFRDANGKGGYFGFDGRNKHRSLLASPLEFSRVTSGFAMRMHPTMNEWKQHKGVDYSAPTGTPVRNVGDGVVEFAGWQNGYGNVVQVKHSNERSTIYAHLSRIDVKQGQHVDQGVRLGAVGATGWATGPHLHFEFKVAGLNQNPLAIARSSEAVAVALATMPAFTLLSNSLKGQLEVAETLAHTSQYAE